MYLLDTNIFLEILLNQEKKLACQEFISKNSDRIAICDLGFVIWDLGIIEDFDIRNWNLHKAGQKKNPAGRAW